MKRECWNERRDKPLGKIGLSIGVVITAASFVTALAGFPAASRAEEKKASDAPPRAKKTDEASAKSKPTDAERQERLKQRLERRKARERRAEMNKEKEKEQAALPPRPARSVAPPSLTSTELDSLIRKHLAATNPNITPAPLTSDVEFVRRVYFDLIGQPPTPAQVQSFVRDSAKDKRSRLIDRLLTTPEFAANWARYWRDVVKFHATNPTAARGGYAALENWLTEKFRKNAPWDDVAAEMITATGRTDENGAVGFALAHAAQPIELAGEVSRVFMGIQIQCAQCHDHKSDVWKQRQFHEFAAFFAGGRQRRFEKPSPGQPAIFGVTVQGRPKYSYTTVEDPKNPIAVAPKFFLDSTAAESNPKSDAGSPAAKSTAETSSSSNLSAEARRALAASYITGQDNPWFAKAFVNRIWYALIGEAFYTPIDDIGPERDVTAPEVLEPLASQWQKGGCDVRWLFRTIMNTETYQRRVRSTSNAAGVTAFASNCPSRLRADQILLALSQALDLPIDLDAEAPPFRQAGKFKNKNKSKAEGANGEKPKDDDKDKDKNRGKGSGKEVPIRTAAARKTVEAPPSDAKNDPKNDQAVRAKRRQAGLVRNFDNVFGVDPSALNEDVLGTIPQALFMMNSPVVNLRTQARPGTVLGEILKTAPNDQAALRALYLRVLSRPPTPKEVETCARHLASVGNRAEAFEDVYWCLINSTEFISRR